MTESSEGCESELVSLDDVCLADLFEIEESALAASVRRVLREHAEDRETVARFNSML
jgi:FXSXX-COOH protein